MNATELAFLLDKSRKESYTSENLVGKAASMLRKQQAVLIAEQEHNEMLEAELKAMREQLNANQV